MTELVLPQPITHFDSGAQQALCMPSVAGLPVTIDIEAVSCFKCRVQQSLRHIADPTKHLLSTRRMTPEELLANGLSPEAVSVALGARLPSPPSVALNDLMDALQVAEALHHLTPDERAAILSAPKLAAERMRQSLVQGAALAPVGLGAVVSTSAVREELRHKRAVTGAQELVADIRAVTSAQVVPVVVSPPITLNDLMHNNLRGLQVAEAAMQLSDEAKISSLEPYVPQTSTEPVEVAKLRRSRDVLWCEAILATGDLKLVQVVMNAFNAHRRRVGEAAPEEALHVKYYRALDLLRDIRMTADGKCRCCSRSRFNHNECAVQEAITWLKDRIFSLSRDAKDPMP